MIHSDRPLLSIIIPTMARWTLPRLLDSIPDDDDLEALIIGDTFQHDFTDAFYEMSSKFTHRTNIQWLIHDGGLHMYGHPQRNYGMYLAKGDWLMFSQDDNVYLDGAFDLVRERIHNQTFDQPMLFRIDTWQAGIVWKDEELRNGNLDADCIIVPNIPEKLGKWRNYYSADTEFILETADLWDNDVMWCKEVIARARPDVA